MNKKDILELKRRFKKDECTFTRMCGCYVDAQKNIVLKINETFLNLRDEEFFKYLEIAKKALSGTVGNNLLELNFPLDGENMDSRQLSLLSLKKSALKDAALLDSFYNLIIDSYDYAGNFLILIFHDAYDVMTKTTDNSKLDESEEIYEYLLCAICPVSLSKAALGYLEDENRIGARNRDWIVGPPDLGFVFPAFTDRSTDIHSIMYYTKNAKDTHPELMEQALGCSSKQTATEQKEAFNTIIRKAIGSDDAKSDHLFMEIQETLNNIVDENSTVNGTDAEPVILTNDNIQDILVESGIPEEITEKIEKSYKEEFADTPPVVENLIDKKALAANEQRKKEKRLEQKVQVLEERLEQTKKEIVEDSDKESVLEEKINIPEEAATDTTLEEDSNSEIAPDNQSDPSYDIVLKVKPEKVPEIKSQIIDGKKCIVIPLEENEQANVNGVDALL
ncbi:uncharacterized protein YheU (UPF0270 family) [Clostridium acetobutylicum]|uniref:DUF4317 domain-containing protein n=1 Tax=Clostridium acetobutylicum (strain ATCC 824 / DSM 792 / JCM 1419 / IAM 19013 / LMG 5710 / NBRC 13948 / NRRL B-527 / VKM B-1787 / 2291 / W) TaxID=272562 RepID=Q97L37_CLOAB|nr:MULTISPECIES: DUF4317 domain-containing protein [Clostridium]AAK78705.1 Hypothetical protein CA_C0729 [Clostridium acetobutylicum ATCC 824]ADZ19779.1 Conserved hypothetical protein [Clostridium acetobutylicum EA 2018]AEI31399.1 hypothetical protein SMB_G0745 [Clostridium acetobutylicum DSM 1731]AWV80424.1 DUF4317 family protein [Clostridium acetobutylicum]MBC2392614.1 DUF4317 family protein [Clostridium acetobutylicum]